ncbi:hypothetical protein COLO4_14555 [Corchorus olitorius]|uniref:Leucine-rich repeat-containing N-terminal plant-type domain-containing protein n=1 Tax=Corchorus olitorius TaxID=93759 RepID=A0A1R3JRQ0_9ROSI|nr:hypothetical protein COLO4_14555 [Corchorus olitorius]
MKQTCFSCRIFFFHVILLLWLTCLESATFANESDRLALLDFKNRVTNDPRKIMASWNDSLHFCSWFGVTCSPSNGRVVILNLEAQNLAGSIPPSIGNLTFLTGINLRSNNFHGELPQELGRLSRLQHLNLSINSFIGKIPTNLTYCTKLTILNLGGNGLIGEIPHQLDTLYKLEYLVLAVNNLTGTIPTWIVDKALPGHVMDIVDQSMFSEENVYKSGRQNREDYVEEKALTKNQDWQVRSTRMIEECLVSMMKIGLSCAATLPSERMTMNIVVKKLLNIKGMLPLATIAKSGRNLVVVFKRLVVILVTPPTRHHLAVAEFKRRSIITAKNRKEIKGFFALHEKRSGLRLFILANENSNRKEDLAACAWDCAKKAKFDR